MSTLLPLTPDELLTTTRSVRRRLDLTRPVDPVLIEECLTVAQQAPTGSNAQDWHFIVVTDPDRRAALAEVYRRGVAVYTDAPFAATNLVFDDPARTAQQARVMSSIQYLAERLDQVPVLVFPCVIAPGGRLDDQPAVMQTSWWSTIAQASWSFMLAARARGLGTVWTTLHLCFEIDAAEILGVPDHVNQAGMIPVAHTQPGPFSPARRQPLDTMLHWQTW